MLCPSCGQENREDASFCGECGALLAGELVCAGCGRPNPLGRKFCDGCGQRLAEAAPAPTPTVPTSFAAGRYQVKRFLGEGGRKRVFLAHDTRLDRDVAFSLIKTEGLDASGLARVRREAQAMGRLGSHPHIVTVFDIGDENRQPYIIQEFMEGGSVQDIVDQAPDHRLSIDQCLQVAWEVCQALQHAHDRGIIHRDVKPGNIWLTADGHGRLGDFGLAVALDLSRLTQAGMMVGTVAYMPPEQALGGKVDTRSDLYGLGATLYEMTCGRPPFSGHDPVAVISQHLNTPPVAPSFHNPSLPPALNDLILKLLAKNPEDRPSSADEALAVLQTLREQIEQGEVVAPAEPVAAAPIGRVLAEEEDRLISVCDWRPRGDSEPTRNSDSRGDCRRSSAGAGVMNEHALSPRRTCGCPPSEAASNLTPRQRQWIGHGGRHGHDTAKTQERATAGLAAAAPPAAQRVE